MKRGMILLAALLGIGSALAGTLVQFRTVFGDVEVELMDQEKPVTTANFLRYLNEGAYDGLLFHRQVPGFVIQGGGIRVTNFIATSSTNDFELVSQHPPITNEFGVGPLVSNTFGTLAMAKTSDPNSATSEFFFNLADNSQTLNNVTNSGGFTVFGRTVGGLETLKTLDTFEYRRDAGVPLTNLVVNLGYFPTIEGGRTNYFPLNELPITFLYTNQQGQATVRFQDLVYVDITTLKVAVRPLETGGRAISWGGIAEATNVVEFTTSFPPQWQTLTNVVKPTIARPEVIDASGDPRRFYRVRADFPPNGL